MKKYLIGFCGHLDRKAVGENGQTLKTISLLDELIKVHGKENIYSISTHDWKKHPFRLLFRIIKMSINCKNIVMLPDQNGVKVIIPVFSTLSRFNHNRLIYCVVGAWLSEKLKKHKFLKKACSRLDVILVETSALKSELSDIGIKNTDILKNFKNIKRNEFALENCALTSPVKICFFSRVVKMKGIEDAINVVQRINKESGKKIVFDIYGPIDSDYKVFIEKMIGNDVYISLKGQANAFEAVDIISKYSFQFFPTRFKTEGIPGSVIDSFFAGVPLLASKWNSFQDLLIDGYNSFLFDIGNDEELYAITKYAININEKQYRDMKKNTLECSATFSPGECIKVLEKYLSSKRNEGV